MSFFGKLRDRLFKSSAKLEEGIDAIVAEGGEVDVSETTDPDVPPPDPTPTEPEPPSEAPGPTKPDTVPRPKTEPAATSPEPAPPEGLEVSGPRPPEVPEPSIPPARERPTHEPAGVPTWEPESAPDLPPPEIPAPPREDTVVAPAAETRPGVLGRLLGRQAGAQPVVRRVVDDDMLESLEELLIASDMGVDTALRVTANLAEGHLGRRLSTQEIKRVLAVEIERIMDGVAAPLPLYASKPQVVLVVGVNGSGKTTTIGKLASQFRAAGKTVMIAAGDTFRAAAVEQLQVWGERAGVPVMTAPQGSDPASLAFDAMTRAQDERADLLMIDTAGRLQNRADLMEELAKIVRVIRKKDPEAPHNTILVLDATTGQNALKQVEVFRQMADVTGLVMTKLDGTAKGGVLVALADKFGLPIHAIGVGEQIDDLDAFDPGEFARALTGAAA